MPHNTPSATFLKKMDLFERQLERFLASPDLKEGLIQHVCHTRKWLYEHGQTVCVKLLPNRERTWQFPSDTSWSSQGTCIVLVHQISFSGDSLAEIGRTEDFEAILTRSTEEARTVAEQLFEAQKEHILSQTRKRLPFMRSQGHLD